MSSYVCNAAPFNLQPHTAAHTAQSQRVDAAPARITHALIQADHVPECAVPDSHGCKVYQLHKLEGQARGWVLHVLRVWMGPARFEGVE